jgi:hypothetical protein
MTKSTETVKLKSVHTYQYVVFQQRNYQFFTESKELGLKDLQLDYYPAIGAVRIKTDKDEIFVFTTNIAYARPMTEETAKVSDLGRAKLKDIDPGKAVK